MCQCPHGLVPHCYNNHESQYAAFFDACQCPHGLVPHCYEDGSGRSQILSVVSMPSRASTSLLPQSLSSLRLGEDDVNALTGLYLIVTQCVLPHYVRHIACVNALSGLYLIVTVMLPPISSVNVHRVSMPSRAYTSLLRDAWKSKSKYEDEVSMPSRAYTSLLPFVNYSNHNSTRCVNALSGLYLIVTKKDIQELAEKSVGVNALSGLYLIVTRNV